MAFLPLGNAYAAVDCIFHGDEEHISHGIDLAVDYEHSHDTIFLDQDDLGFLTSGDDVSNDYAIDHALENQCSGSLALSASCDSLEKAKISWKDPFLDSRGASSLHSVSPPQEIRPPII